MHEVADIIALERERLSEPPPLVARQHGNLLTAMSQLDEERLLTIIDVEKVIAEVFGAKVDDIVEGAADGSGANPDPKDERIVFLADDSAVARAQVARTLDRMGIAHLSASNESGVRVGPDAIAGSASVAPAGSPVGSISAGFAIIASGTR